MVGGWRWRYLAQSNLDVISDPTCDTGPKTSGRLFDDIIACSPHRNAPRPVLQDSTGVSDLYTRSVHRASGFVLVGNSEVAPLSMNPHLWFGSASGPIPRGVDDRLRTRSLLRAATNQPCGGGPNFEAQFTNAKYQSPEQRDRAGAESEH